MKKRYASALLGLCAWSGTAAFGDTRIAVLDFELNDLTPLPRTAEELKRTASVAPLLREALVEQGGYEPVLIDPAIHAGANLSFGYLLDHTEAAAALGRRLGVDWIAVGRVHKPSFLFAYLKVHLVNVATERLAGDYVVEVKGSLETLTARGAARLAERIHRTISESRSLGLAGSRSE